MAEIRRRWPALRAGLIAGAIAIGLVDGCPLPPERDVLPWQRGIVDVVRPVQQAVMTPFAWIPRGLRFSQRWALMQVGPRDRFRFTVEGGTAAGWSVLYRANDPDHAAFADQLENDHVFGTWNPTSRLTGQYTSFSNWFSAYVLAARPELSAVRLSYENIIIEDGELRGTGTFVFPMIRHRGSR